MHRNRESIGINGQVKRRSPFSRINGHTPIGLAAWVGVALAPATTAQVQAVPGYSYTTPYKQSGGTSIHEFTRGVDAWEDGIVWSVTGIGATSNDLKQSLGATFLAQAHTPQGGFITSGDYSLTLRSSLFQGGYSPDRLWPNDLVCDDPSNNLIECGPGWSRAIAVGGWRTIVPPGNAFESSSGSQEIPACVEPNADHAWLHIVKTPRDHGDYRLLYPVTATGQFVTFVAMNPISSIELITVDSAPSAYVACASSSVIPDQEVNEFAPAATAFAAGGTFSGTAQFQGPCTIPASDDPPIERVSNGGTDGFVTLHYESGVLAGTAEPILQLGSTGDDGVLGVSINHQTGRIVVCGYFSGALDFDPFNSVPHILNSAGGRDLFVASYTIPTDPSQSWVLDWVHNYGTTADEQAEGVWSDVSGQVYVVGHRTSGGTTSMLRMRYDPNCSGAVPCFNPWGMQTLSSTAGMIKGLDVCVDGIGRPIITGTYSGEVTFAGASGYSSTTLASAGGTDGFVARMDIDDGTFQWAYSIGGSTNDTSTDVNVCQFNSARLVHGGDFSGTANFKPGGGSTMTASAVDGYTNYLDHMPEGSSGVKSHLTLLLDHVPDHRADLEGALTSQTDWDSQVDAIADELADATNDWDDGRLSMRVVMYHANFAFNYHHPYPMSSPPPGEGARDQVVQYIPSVTLSSNKESRWFGTRLKNLSWHRHWVGGIDTEERDRALRVAGDAFGYAATNSIYPVYTSHASSRHTLLPLHFNQTAAFCSVATRKAVTGRDPVVTNPFVDQLNSIALYYGEQLTDPLDRVTRDIVRSFATDSKVRIDPVVDGESNLGFAAQADEVPPVITPPTPGVSPWLCQEYRAKLERMFLRMTVCPADYNRASGVEGVWLSGADYSAWAAAQLSSTPYADWDFNGSWPGTNPSIHGDAAKFKASYDATCP